MRGPAKCFFHRPCWEIFAMVSIQIWVTRFHIRGTGEQRQVCLAAVTGCPFFSTGPGQQHEVRLVTRDVFVHCFPRRNDTTEPPAANVKQVSQNSPQGQQDLLASQPNTGRRRVRVLRRIGTSVSQAHENNLFHIECALAFKAVIMDD